MEKFIELIKEMRMHQTDFFKTHNRSSMFRARELEREVDSQIKYFARCGQFPEPKRNQSMIDFESK
jgi:hypothetical protein